MFNTENILNMLQSGQDADAIAKQFTEALNQAIAQQKAQDNFNEKVEFMQEIIDDLFDFIEEFYPDMEVSGARKEVDPVEIVRGLDDTYKEVSRIKKMLQAKKVVPVSKLQPKPATGGTDAIAEFLKRNGL